MSRVTAGLIRHGKVGTLETLRFNRGVIANFVQRYKGRIVDSPGHNILAVFESVSNTVSGAVEIQRELAERNTQVPSARTGSE